MTLWDAVDQFSSIWAFSPMTERFREGLASQPASTAAPPLAAQSVADVLAMYGLLRAQPLLLAQRLPQTPAFPSLAPRPEFQEWLPIAVAFARTLLEVVEFLRSRLPNYPALLIPDLANEATRVRHDGFWDARFPWQTAFRRSGLQFKNEPEFLRSELAFPDGGRAAYAALGVVAQELHRTLAWQEVVRARSALGENEIKEARQLAKDYRSSVSDADQVAGDRGMRNATYRRGRLEQIPENAGRSVRDYYEAFAAVDEVINAVAALISHRVAVGRIGELHPAQATWGRDQELRDVRIVGPDDDVRHLNEILRVSTGIQALTGLMIVSSMTFNWNRDTGTTLTAAGSFLSGSVGVSP